MKGQNKNEKDQKAEHLIISNKYNEVLFDFNQTLKEKFSNKIINAEFSPLLSNDILVVENTKTTIVILLRNGTLMSLGEESVTLGRKIFDLNDMLKPGIIPLKKKIVDVSCGKDHCLAKSEDSKLYSWGNNFYGQLGITNFPTSWESNKEEPIEIGFFSAKRVTQMKAGPYNSFAIEEENNLYGWGSNENGQLLYDNDTKKLSTPVLVNFKENIEDFVVMTNKKSKSTYIFDVTRNKAGLPSENENMMITEIEQKKEIEKLTFELNDAIKRSGGVILKEGETLEEVRMSNIQSLINSYEEKTNEIELSLLSNKGKETEQMINSYIKQIEYNSLQEAELKDKYEAITSAINYESLKTKTPQGQQEEETDTPQSSEDKKTQKAKILADNKKSAVNPSSRVINVEELIDKANSELQIQKHHVLNERVKSQNDKKKKEKEIKSYQEQIALFEKVKEEYKKYSQLKVDSEKIKDVHHTMIKLEREIKNFDINLLKNMDKMNYDNNSLLDILEQSLGNIKKLDQKVYSMNIDQSNETSKKIISNFYSNSNLAKQNNILMQEIIYHSQSFYYKVFDKLLKPDKIDNFTKLKETIDYKKASMANKDEEEEQENSIEDKDQDMFPEDYI